MATIGRVLTAMVTPFSPDGSIDEKRTAQLAQALVASGSDGLVVTGTTGESPTLSHREKLRLYEIVRAAVGPETAVIAGTSTYNTAESVELTREAAHLGVDGFLLVVPPYNKPTQEGMYRHFAAIASATTLPCILYNVPGRTGSNLLPSTVLRLRQFANIVGIKEASGDLEQIATIIEAAGPEFRVWSGDDNLTLPILAVGGYGVISVASHLVGRQIQEMIHAFLAGQNARAAAIHRRLLPLVKALFVVGNPVPVKYALGVAGFPVGECRLPLYGPDEETARIIRHAIERQQIDLPMATTA
ncbi:MAG: 4-hydroxy-tetrahydrodipicolinate synthase [Chloroflexota bacterium]|nr:4-hydroxy-tetrahydrodipicolinate synthase [Dehalococcoidia bacterium]MDW8253107.1 4-hydroxy-tetrahydrodipicolinate synthase [Chloroflexota bacterium]